MRGQLGYTLLEVAIVLVIAGLILGATLKGQEMVTQARIKCIINELSGISAAVNAYKDRYHALPGDDPRAGGANGRWGTRTASGNGDGQWASSGDVPAQYKVTLSAAPTGADETNLFWQHLRLAGLIPDSTVTAASATQPPNGVSGIIGVQSGAGTPTLGFSSNIVCTTNLSETIANAVDTQLDDGAALTGWVRGVKQHGPLPDLTPATAVAALGGDTNYVANHNNQYTLCKTL